MSGSSPSEPRRRWDLAVTAALLAALPLVSVRAVSDPSPWLHLRVGEYLLGGGRFGRPDPWGPMTAHTYVPTQWLPSVLVARAYELFGLSAVVWTRGVGIVALAVGLLWLTRGVSRPVVAAGITALALAGSWSGLSERPQLAGFVLLVPAIAAWWRTGTDHRPRWWLIPLTWLAASTHGVWSLGLVVGGVVVLGLGLSRSLSLSSWLRLAGLLFGCLVAAAVTPIGPRLVLTPFTVGSNGREFVTEWLPSSVRSPHVALVLGLLALAYGGWVASGRRPPLWQVLSFVAAIGFTLTMQRTVAVGAFIAAPLLAEQVETLLARRDHSPRLVRLVRPGRREAVGWAVGLVLAAVVAVPLSSAHSARVRAVPTALSQQVAALPAGSRVVADGDVTGWLLFTAPQTRPVFDLRIEAYGKQYVEDYISAMEAAPGWPAFIARAGATSALLPASSPLGLALVEQLGWSVVARGDGYQLLVAS